MSDDVFGSASEGDVSSGQDTTELQEDVSEEETTQLNVEVPESLHRRLKMESVRRDEPMKRVVADILDRSLGT